MPDFRRNFQPGGCYFFTVVSDRRAPILCSNASRAILRAVLAECRMRRPFRIDAVVLLPDHLHTIWTLPEGDARYPARWGWIKKEFTSRWLRDGGREQPQTDGRRRDGRRGVLQPKYWEHTLRRRIAKSWRPHQGCSMSDGRWPRKRVSHSIIGH